MYARARPVFGVVLPATTEEDFPVTQKKLEEMKELNDEKFRDRDMEIIRLRAEISNLRRGKKS